jgi:hypothetical protein
MMASNALRLQIHMWPAIQFAARLIAAYHSGPDGVFAVLSALPVTEFELDTLYSPSLAAAHNAQYRASKKHAIVNAVQ